MDAALCARKDAHFVVLVAHTSTSPPTETAYEQYSETVAYGHNIGTASVTGHNNRTTSGQNTGTTSAHGPNSGTASVTGHNNGTTSGHNSGTTSAYRPNNGGTASVTGHNNKSVNSDPWVGLCPDISPSIMADRYH